MKKVLLAGVLVTSAIFASFTAEMKPAGPKSLKLLPLSEVKPEGWIKNLMLRDMKQGYLSILEETQPTLKHNVFGPAKVSNMRIDKNGDYTIRKETWWWGEHEGYWADLIIRNGFLTGDQELIHKADSIVNHVLKHQEADGYIGIYQKDIRLNKLKGENGELWAQSRMLGALLAYYEFTGKREVLQAVERAVQLTMAHYGPGKASYFKAPKSNGGGTSHGLMFLETLEMLHRYTGNQTYADFGLWLYNDYSTSKITNNKDNQMAKLLNRDQLFIEHGVHIVEGNRTVLWLATLTKDPKFQTAFNNIFYKMNASTVPSGALVSDELVEERAGNPDLHYEFCTMTERVISSFSGLQKSGNAALADEIENVVFNASQGARLADMSALSYCSMDNRKEAYPKNDNFRFQYSANHNPACCNLSAGKLYPYFVSNLWMKTQDEKGLVATAFGPSSVSTAINGANVTINEVTEYPFENQVTFKITTDKPAEFSVLFRKPKWATKTNVNARKATTKFEDGYYVVTGKWKTGDKITVTFDSKVEALKAVNGESYVQNGPLLYSLPIQERRDTVKTFKPGFYAFNMFPQNPEQASQIFEKYKLVLKPGAKNSGMSVSRNRAANKAYPWDVPYSFLTATFEVDGKEKTEKLYPLGSTTLRKLTFPVKGS
ncbi:beta-L-arabinofuranosidase domain-containing protein [Botryobacter ruber]|uniref:beta-L-arabinofuranosidase domain-containing protein n=1 Tax=Botryobacter ruber TaxID=2171629 RepID=UPI000E0B7566|nr:beta-L-arabinofuranosidase domain-containing protein [Botryobacter ruber]